MKKYNLSIIMKRAWEIVKKAAITISATLKEAWKKAKEAKEDIVETLKKNLEAMAYGDYHINAGVDRVVNAKLWEKGGARRMYLSIACFTMAGRPKGTYKCGYVDLITGQYVCGKYDDVDAANCVYIGK